MEKKGQIVFRIIVLLVLFSGICGAATYGYRWHASALADKDAAYAAQELEALKLQDRQDRQIARLIDQLHMDDTSYKLESFVGGVRIKLLNNTDMYFEARKGTEVITVHFTSTISPATIN